MLSPVVLTAKRILRDLCKRWTGWDDIVPESVSKEWLEWLQQLHLLEKFEVSRSMKPPGFGQVTSAQLHHFCDASEHGYGTVTYLLLKAESSEVHSAFVMGKARVAPFEMCNNSQDGAYRCNYGQPHRHAMEERVTDGSFGLSILDGQHIGAEIYQE